MDAFTVQPKEWLTDEGLSETGKSTRKTFSNFMHYLNTLPMPMYKVSRALHLLQSHMVDTLPDGYSLPPHTINFCVNNRCNLHCSYCDLNHGRKGDLDLNTKVRHNVIDVKKLYELSLDTCRRIIDESIWYKPTIRVPWMEPLLYRNLLPLIEYTKTKGLPFSMLTNGLLLPKYADRLASAGVDALRVSLDGPAHVHDLMCGVSGTFERVVKGLKILANERKKHDLPIQIGCYYTVNDKNYDQMLPFVRDLERRGLLDEMYIGFYMFNYISKRMVEDHNREHAPICGATVEETSAQYVDLISIDTDIVLQQKEEIEEIYIAKGYRINFRPNFTKANLSFLLDDDAGIYPESRCETPWHTLYINPNGDVKPLPQCILPPVGNIEKRSLMDVWNGEEMRRQRVVLRKHGAFYGCMRCWSIYSNIEDMQDSWRDHAIKRAAGHV